MARFSRPPRKASADPTGTRGRAIGRGWDCRRHAGMVIGHEFSGVVEEVGKEVKDFKKGARVVVPFSQGDGTCEYCRSGNSNICLTPLIPGVTYHGGYGSYADAVRRPQPGHMPSGRTSRRGLAGMPLHDFVPRNRRPRASAAGRMGRGARMRRNRTCGDPDRVLDRRQRYRGRSRRPNSNSPRAGRREPHHQREAGDPAAAIVDITRAARTSRSTHWASPPLAAIRSRACASRDVISRSGSRPAERGNRGADR